MNETVLITGAAGFIGFHLSKLLLSHGMQVIGVDAITDYYDVSLKEKRLEILSQNKNFEFHKMRIDDATFIEKFASYEIKNIVHLAAQAGVRYSIEQPREYVDTNLIGTFNVLELSKKIDVAHLLMASTSSVYGSNTEMPFSENEKADTQMSFYAATKKANEAMAHSYAHIHNIPTTMFRFFTVYGSWGRPDMALFKFADAMLSGKPIDVYNNGKMERDFTYVSDLVHAIMLLIDVIPHSHEDRADRNSDDSISDVAPFRIVNIGNSNPVKLMDYIKALEDALGIDAQKNYLPMQQGDVPATYANTNLLESLTSYRPNTTIENGVAEFAVWYLKYKRKEC
jgi:UDP-glucuronate 4-epimerase